MKPVVVFVGIESDGVADLLQVVDALNRPRPFPGLLQCGQQHRSQDRDDRYHDQQFDQRKAAFH